MAARGEGREVVRRRQVAIRGQRAPVGERQQQRAATAQEQSIQAALAALTEDEGCGRVAPGTVPGTVAFVKQAFAAAAADREQHQRTKERLQRTEKRLGDILEERDAREKELREHLRATVPGRGACALSYATFRSDKVLQRDLSQWLFFDSMDAFDAYAALLDSYYPLEKINYIDASRARRTLGPLRRRLRRRGFAARAAQHEAPQHEAAGRFAAARDCSLCACRALQSSHAQPSAARQSWRAARLRCCRRSKLASILLLALSAAQ